MRGSLPRLLRLPRAEWWFSLDHAHFWMGREQGLGEDVVEGEDPEEGDDDPGVDGAPNSLGAAGRGHALVTGDDRDDRSEQRALHDRAPQVGGRRVREQRREEGTERLAEGQ